jgi:hypothetical protein
MQVKTYMLVSAAIFYAATLIPQLNALAPAVPASAGVPAIAYAFPSAFFNDDEPHFEVARTGEAGFTVSYRWTRSPEGPKSMVCVVTVRVGYSPLGDKYKNGRHDEEFSLTNKIYDTGHDWEVFDVKSDLDNTAPSVDISGEACR